MAYNFFKKLDAEGNPTGDLYIRKNMQQVHPNLDLNDATAVRDAGYCYHLNSIKKNYQFGNYTKIQQNNGDIVVGNAADNVYDHDWQEVDISDTLSAEELQERKDRAWKDLRDLRNWMLSRTDWWELSSQSPMSAERTAYRQALRDLPSNTTDPFNVTWPNNPDTPDDANPFE